MKTFAERLAYLRKLRGLTQKELGTRLGVSRGAVANWETGGDISRENQARLSTALDASLDWLEKAEGSPPHVNGNSFSGIPVEPNRIGDRQSSVGVVEQSNATLSTASSGHWRRLPVYGQAVAGVDGEFVMNGSVLFHAMAPPNVVAIANAYGVRVSGESMSPRYFDGEVVFVDPTRVPRKGDFVVVQIQWEEGGEFWGYVKQFVRHNSHELVLSQFNPAKEMTFPHKTVRSVHVIVMGGMG
jgi:phage repressor protein C with HTH and peptisase S24 domain